MADELREDVFGLREEHQVLLVAHLLHAGVEVGQQGEAAVVLAEQFGRVPDADVGVVEPAHLAQQGLQPRDERRRRRTGRTPAFGREAHLARRVGERPDGSGRHGLETMREAAALPLEVGGADPGFVHDPHGLLRHGLHPLLGAFRAAERPADQPPQLLFRTGAGQCGLVLLLEKLAAQRQNPFADVPFPALFDAFVDELRQPPLQFAVFGDLFDEQVGAACQDRFGFDLDGVVQLDAQLLDEGPQNTLEKGVDREDREARVVVQDLRAHRARPLPHGVGVEAQLLAQPAEVGVRSARGELVDLAEDARLHLLGGLVGEGHRQDVPVQVGLFDHVADVVVRQLVGLARPCARIQNCRSHSSFCRFGQ